MTTKPKNLLISIHPKPIKKIISGSKDIEIRKTKPNIKKGDNVWGYATRPESSLKVKFECGGVIECEKSNFWLEYGSRIGITKDEFESYLSGKMMVYGIIVSNLTVFDVSLVALKQIPAFEYFQPPQGFYYLSDDQISELNKYLKA